jgi:hypothetical protein
MIEPEYEAFAACWNEGRFFEAHEVLEGLWMRTRDPGQQGLIQLAAALHHVRRGNVRGARTMIGRALARLGAARAPGPIDIPAMMRYANVVGEALNRGDATGAVEARPRIVL